MYGQEEKLKLDAGSLLIAEPFMADPNFKRSVILLCEYHTKGALGFILNKSLKMKVNDLLDSFPDFDADVYYGGPVGTNTIHFVHNVGDLLDDSYLVMDNIYMGGDFEQLKSLVKAGLIQPNNIRFFVGYSGWGARQLNGEIERGSWMTSTADPNYVFNLKNNKKLWQKVLQHKGDRYGVIAQLPDSICWS